MSAVSQPRRKPTSTSSFGVGRREAHDATAFYEREGAKRAGDVSSGSIPARTLPVLELELA